VTTGDRYRAKALELFARADGETNSEIQTEFKRLASAFLRLAEQADQNAALIIEFELPPKSESDTKQ
jgi:hypothetical protein